MLCRVRYYYVMLFFLIGQFFLMVCQHKTAELPITTRSKEALGKFIAGRDLAEAFKSSDANRLFKKALDLDPDFALAHLYFAQTGTHLSPQQVLEHMNKAVQLADKVTEGEKLYILSAEAATQSNWPEYKKLCEQLVALYPKCKRAQMAMGYYYVVQQDYETAIQYCNKAIELDPNFSPPYDMIGYYYGNMGNYAESEKALQKYIELVPNLANPHDALGEEFMHQGKFKESIMQYQKAISIDPQFYESYIGLANSLALSGEGEGARLKLQELNDIAPDYFHRATALLATAITYCYEDRFNEAMTKLYEQFNVVKKEQDEYSMFSVLINIATVYIHDGNYAQAKEKAALARKILEKSKVLTVEMNDNLMSDLLLVEVELDLYKNDYQSAQARVSTYQATIKTDPAPAIMQGYHGLLGRIALQQGRYDEAISELEQASNQSADNIYLLGLAYEGRGDKTKADEMYARAAHFNTVLSLDFALVRNQALKKLPAQ
jgi:tetratricopeptide (TPR) repeat protein